MGQKLKLFLYKMEAHQRISDSEKFYGIYTLQYSLNALEVGSKFLKRIIFSDECKLLHSGIVNKQISYI